MRAGTPPARISFKAGWGEADGTLQAKAASPIIHGEREVPVKILQIHNSYLQGGGEDVLLETQVAALRSVGEDVTVARVTNPDRITDQVPAYALAPWNPSSAKALGGIVDRLEPDVAHLHNTWYRWSPSVIKALRGQSVPVVMTVHNYRLMCVNATFYRNGAPCTDCLGTHPWRGVVHGCYHGSAAQSFVAAGTLSLNRALRTWHRGVDRFAVSTEFLSNLLQVAGFAEDRIRLVRPTIPDLGVRSRPPSQSDQVVYAGRLEAQKGLESFLDSWRRMDTGLELVIVGDGPLRASLERLQIPRVTFLGWLPHNRLRPIMLNARALVFPSNSFETLGLSLVEGLSAGLPAVAFDVGTRREVVGSDGAGWLVPPDAARPWDDALGAINDDAAIDAAGVAARARYEQRFAPKVTVPALIDLYRELAGT
jgi:glycosyltransferase involved in cell wall biosynthesis